MGKKIIYLLKDGDGRYKIGFAKNVDTRVKQLQTGNATKISKVYCFETYFFAQIESSLHYIFNEKRGNGEWFYLCDDDITFLIKECESINKNLTQLEETKKTFLD